MAKYYIGIDGGGSKTRYLCVDREGNRLGEALTEGAYCAQDGVETVISRLRDGISRCLPRGAEDVAIGFGMPAYGENTELDLQATRDIREAFAPMKIRFENDAVLGWASALAMNPGVSVVGGTGSIGYGRDSSGSSARCGGWHEFMSDEGSGYWLGKKLLRLFSKESDGRLPRTPLYELTRQALGLENDLDINSLACSYCRSRCQTAALQKILLEAARQGDYLALGCYDKASRELAEIVAGVINKLSFDEGETIRVSYTGGLFEIKELIRVPVEKKLKQLFPGRIQFTKPLLCPCEGAVLLAMEEFDKDDYLAYKEKIQSM